MKTYFYRPRPQFIILSLILSLLIVNNLLGQTRTYKIEDTKLFEKVEAIIVPDMLQDEQGFIWIYSQFGLMRYDGYEIREYPSPFSDTSVIDKAKPPLGIRAAGHYSKTGLWFRSSDNHLLRFDKEKDRLVPFVATPDTKLFNLKDSTSTENVLEDIFKLHIIGMGVDNDEIWCSIIKEDNSYGFFQLIPDKSSFGLPTGKIKEIHYYDNFEETLKKNSSYYTPLYKEVNGIDTIVWLVMPDGLCEFNKTKEEYTKYQVIPDTAYNPFNNFFFVFTDIRDEMFFLGTVGDAIATFDLETKKLKRYEIPVKNLGFDKKNENSYFMRTNCRFFDYSINKVWITAYPKNTNPIILLFDIDTHTFEKLELTDGNPLKTIKLYNSASLLQDATGNKWFINDDGFYKGSKTDQVINNIPFGKGLIDLDNNGTLLGPTLVDGDSGLWITNYKSILHLNLKTRKTKTYPFTKENIIGYKSDFANDLIRNFSKDSKGNIWVGAHKGLFKFNPENGQYTYINALPYEEFYATSGFDEDTKGNLWILNWRKLYRYNPTNDTYIEYIFPEHGINGHTFGLQIDPNGHVWLGNMNFKMPSLFSFDPSKAVEKDGKMHIEDYDKYNFRSAFPLLVDTKGYVWCTSWGSGVYRVNPITKEYAQFTVMDGLAENFANGIIEDDDGYIWITTQKGLSRFDPQRETFKNFYESDGLLSDNFPALSTPSKNKKGELLFYTKEGVIYFDPSNLKPNPVPPNIYFSGLEILDKEAVIDGEDSSLQAHISQTEEITLEHWQDVLTFKFAAIHYDNPALNRYKVKLENYEADWRDIEHERRARYANLSPGNYTFRVKAANSDGVWNEEGISLKINILPPWWTTWYAYSIYVLLSVVFLYSLYRYQLNRNLEKAEANRIKELDSFKTRFYTNITHEFRTPLTVIIGMAKEAIVQRNAQSLLQLVNQMLDLSKLESGMLQTNMQQGDVVKFLRYLSESFHSLAEAKHITVHFLPEQKEVIMDFDKEKMQQIISNLLSNAIKFTPESGNVYLMIDKVEQTGKELLQVKVKDTGVGIPADKLPHIFDRFYQVDGSSTREGEGTGIGLSLTKELVKLLEGEITAKSEEGKGTEIVLKLPMTQEAPAIEDASLTIIKESTILANGKVDSTTAEIETSDSKELPLALLVEDNTDVVHYLISCLNDSYRIETASNGQEGINKAKVLLPDIIISDVMMPIKDGYQLCEELKTDMDTSHIPIILLTAKAADSDRIAGLEVGADAYLTKPFQQVELDVRIRKLIEQRNRLWKRFKESGLEDIVEEGVSLQDQAFIKQLNEILEGRKSEPDLNTETLLKELGMSRSLLHLKLKSLTGQSTTEYIRNYRLKYAASLIKKDYGNFTQIALEAGFTSLSYFTKSFKDYYGKSPSEFKKV